MYNPKKFSTMALAPCKVQGDEQLTTVASAGGPAVGNPAPTGGNGKQRLRWTSDLHDSFVDAIAQLGGPDSVYLLYILELYSCSFGFCFCQLVIMWIII